jgi:PAS domain S-box-containing protein
MKNLPQNPVHEYLTNPVVYQLIEASNDGFWDWNVKTGDVYFSRRWAEMLGYKQDEIKPHVSSWEKLVHPDDMDHVMKVLTKHLSGETDFYETEHRVRCKNGDWKWILDRGRVIERDQDNTPLRAAGSHTDINDKILHAQELSDLNTKLQNAVNLRNQFLSIASHELKTPLTSLVLLVQMMKKTLALDDKRTVLQKIANSLSQTEKHLFFLVRLIDDMLDISRLESNRFTINRGKFDLPELIKECLERNNPQVFSATGKLLIVDEIPSTYVNWDRSRMDQVLTNLITNAIRYGDGKPISLQVHLRGNHVLISVKDLGHGIDKEDQERIFNLFERAEKTNSIRGLGLGLYISRQIVNAHGGKIWVESQLNQGSVFYVDMPI